MEVLLGCAQGDFYHPSPFTPFPKPVNPESVGFIFLTIIFLQIFYHIILYPENREFVLYKPVDAA